MKIYSGHQTFVSGHREGPYCNAIIGMILLLLQYDNVEWQPHPPGDDLGMKTNRGTRNHRLLYRVYLYGWAMWRGTAKEKAEARRLLLLFFEEERLDGHQGGELWTTSHGQLWYIGVYGARFFALYFKDEVILAATGRWLRADLGLMDLVADENGQINTPCARPAKVTKDSRATASNYPLRNVLYALLKGRKPESVMRLKEPTKPVIGVPTPEDPEVANRWWGDVYNFPALLLRWLINNAKDDLGGSTRGLTEIPKTRTPIRISKHPNGDYVYEISRWKKSGPDILPWTARINGKRIDSPVFSGAVEDWTSPWPAPKLQGVTPRVINGEKS